MQYVKTKNFQDFQAFSGHCRVSPDAFSAASTRDSIRISFIYDIMCMSYTVTEVDWMQKELKNGYVNGIIGALLGALIGAVPWYLAETFLNIFAAVLGLLISMASFYGYMLLGGARKKGFGLAVIIISSVITVCASEYFSNFTVL